MVQRSNGNPPIGGAAGVSPPDGDNNTDPAQRLGRAIVRATNNMDAGPSSVGGEMFRAGLYTAAAGLGAAAAGAALDSRMLTTGGLAGAAVGLALAGYSSAALDRDITENRQAIRDVAQHTAEGFRGLGAQAGGGAEAPADEAPPAEAPQGEEKPKD